MPGQNILIVEDDRKTAELLSDYLALSDFKVSLLYHGDHVVHEVRLFPPEDKFAAQPITINPERYNATITGKNLHLTLIEFQLFKLMASMPVPVAAGVSSSSSLTLGKNVDKYFTDI
jgi:DNA-binding response OmpR family regulator